MTGHGMRNLTSVSESLGARNYMDTTVSRSSRSPPVSLSSTYQYRGYRVDHRCELIVTANGTTRLKYRFEVDLPLRTTEGRVVALRLSN
eukprot:59551-Pleurochrysis_carterae.AAC.1